MIILKEISRRDLVEALEELLSDEFDSSELVYLFDSSELVYLTEEELIRSIINAANFYKSEANN